MKRWLLLILLAAPAAWAEEVTVFLVLLDDGGQRGEAIGCGDSLLPFALDLAARTLRPAEAPEEGHGLSVALDSATLEAARHSLLRAAVEALLALGALPEETPMPNGSARLHNALPRSDLRVARLEADNGAWALYLEGRLVLGGVCEVARLEAQLAATARQFGWSRDLALYLNDRPLGEVLSPR